MKVDDVKSRKEKILTVLKIHVMMKQNTCKRMRAFIMKKKTKRGKIRRKIMKTSLDLTLKLPLEGYKRII